MAMTDYLEQRVIDFTLRANAGFTWTSPTTVYLALFTDATTDAGGGTEVSGGAYARESVAFDSMSAVTDGHTANTSEISFTEATASWGTITYGAVYDALTNGNMLYHGQLTASKPIGNGDTFKVAAGDLDITHA